jgi:hypothetical protein
MSEVPKAQGSTTAVRKREASTVPSLVTAADTLENKAADALHFEEL